jgi:hypothetical protein
MDFVKDFHDVFSTTNTADMAISRQELCLSEMLTSAAKCC